jgi:hypothetical protein
MRTAKSKLVRVDINKDVVAEASAAAAASKPGTNDWADKKQHYLVLRQRGGSVKWTVRGFKKQRVIGDPRDGLGRRDYLPNSAARTKAAQVYAELSGTEPAPRKPAPVLKAKVWTWADLDREYQASRAQPQWVNRRLKAPSQGTCDDIRLTFAKPPMQALHSNLLTELDRLALNAARDKIDGHRAKEKAIAYFKAAMTFAVDRHPDKSGLGDVLPWWEKLSAGDPDPKEMKAIEARRAALLAAKAAFSIDHLAEVLLRHEAYCAGRTGGEKISPGIRWGLWWVSHTANRRFSTVKFDRSNFLVADELGPRGWGRAMWPAEVMKARLGFWLPLPPETVHLADRRLAPACERRARRRSSGFALGVRLDGEGARRRRQGQIGLPEQPEPAPTAHARRRRPEGSVGFLVAPDPFRGGKLPRQREGPAGGGVIADAGAHNPEGFEGRSGADDAGILPDLAAYGFEN